MSATSCRRSVTFVVVLLTIFIEYFALQPVTAFLFTPKFQIYLNTMRGTNQAFVFKWDTLSNQQNNVAGFSYATDQNGKFFVMKFWMASDTIRLIDYSGVSHGAAPILAVRPNCFAFVHGWPRHEYQWINPSIDRSQSRLIKSPLLAMIMTVCAVRRIQLR